MFTDVDELESAAEVAAEEDGAAAPKVKGDGAPDGAVNTNPEPPGFAVDKAWQKFSTMYKSSYNLTIDLK